MQNSSPDYSQVLEDTEVRQAVWPRRDVQVTCDLLQSLKHSELLRLQGSRAGGWVPLKALWKKCQAPKDLLAASKLLDIGTGDCPHLPQVFHAQTIAHCGEGVRGSPQPPYQH